MIQITENLYIAESEYENLEELESAIKEITEKTDRWFYEEFNEDDYQGFRDFLDSGWDVFQTHPKGYKYYPSVIIEEITPALFEQGLKEYYDSESQDWLHDLEILEKALEDYKRENKILIDFKAACDTRYIMLKKEQVYLYSIGENPSILDKKEVPYLSRLLIKLVDLLENKEEVKKKLNNPKYLLDSFIPLLNILHNRMRYIEDKTDEEVEFYSQELKKHSEINFDNYFQDRLEENYDSFELEHIFLNHN